MICTSGLSNDYQVGFKVTSRHTKSAPSRDWNSKRAFKSSGRGIHKEANSYLLSKSLPHVCQHPVLQQYCHFSQCESEKQSILHLPSNGWTEAGQWSASKRRFVKCTQPLTRWHKSVEISLIPSTNFFTTWTLYHSQWQHLNWGGGRAMAMGGEGHLVSRAPCGRGGGRGWGGGGLNKDVWMFLGSSKTKEELGPNFDISVEIYRGIVIRTSFKLRLRFKPPRN